MLKITMAIMPSNTSLLRGRRSQATTDGAIELP